MGCAHPIRALLVEDNPADAVLTQSLLTESLGPAIETRCTERLNAALRCLKHERFDVVILDLLLPDTVGMEGLRRIVRSVPSVPVVILSGVDDEAVEAEAFCEGAQEFLLKGVTFEDLGRAVEKAISRKRTEVELLRLPRVRTGSVISGDDIISAARPAEILVVGAAEVDAVRCATEKYADCFTLSQATSLDDASKMLSERSYDAIVLHPDLPDAWSADAYAVLSEFTDGTPVIMFADSWRDPLVPDRLPRPFCEIRQGNRDVALIRRLLISATLQRRALKMPTATPRLREVIPEPSPKWRH